MRKIKKNDKLYIHSNMTSLLGLYGTIDRGNHIQLIPYYIKEHHHIFEVISILKNKYNKLSINIIL